jgi:hypothetical protein
MKRWCFFKRRVRRAGSQVVRLSAGKVVVE